MLVLGAASTLAVASIKWGATLAFAAVDDTYLHTTTFRSFTDSIARRAYTDSVDAVADARRRDERLSRIDSTVTEIRACQRHPDRCR